MVRVRVRFIGTFRWAAKMDETDLEVPEQTSITDLLDRVFEMVNRVEDTSNAGQPQEFGRNMLILVNDVEVGLLKGFETILRDGDKVTLIPTAHGG
ncbi:MoaD/ThiS family protein [Candidatus Bathyarchaeota archaeon]|nr:MoaD/ThiS family protein [Candidatus Bathyarchaeota archaeon]MBS7628458.1 MoaD/ThiS family protein [Candidatus Bathyarchaeota archaeon]